MTHPTVNIPADLMTALTRLADLIGALNPTPVIPTQRKTDLLTIAQVCAGLDIARSTFHDWRAKGRGPRCLKFPNGDIRIRRAEYERWLTTLEDAA